MMKLTGSVKSILVKKLSESLRERMTLSQFNEVSIFLDRWNNAFKLVPYGIFSDPDLFNRLTTTEAGMVFKRWLDSETCNIDKDFNKGRKLVRLVRSKMDDYLESLAFTLPANDLFLTSLTSFFVEYDEEEQLPFRFPVEDSKNFNTALDMVRRYIAAVFFLDLALESDLLERVLDILVNSEAEGVIDSIIELGLMTM